MAVAGGGGQHREAETFGQAGPQLELSLFVALQHVPAEEFGDLARLQQRLQLHVRAGHRLAFGVHHLAAHPGGRRERQFPEIELAADRQVDRDDLRPVAGRQQGQAGDARGKPVEHENTVGARRDQVLGGGIGEQRQPEAPAVALVAHRDPRLGQRLALGVDHREADAAATLEHEDLLDVALGQAAELEGAGGEIGRRDRQRGPGPRVEVDEAEKPCGSLRVWRVG